MVVRTFLLMGFIRILDCYRNVPMTFSAVGSIFTEWNLPSLFTGGILALGLSFFDFCVIGVGIAVMYLVSRFGDDATGTGSVRDKLWKHPALSAALVCCMLMSVLLFGIYGPGYDASQFIYDQF